MLTAPEPTALDASAAECQALVERVVHSQELRRSARLRELLRFLSRRVLDTHSAPVREQEIGAAVFGRPEEYDTGLDNIVRVNVSELRKRLTHFYAGEGADEAILLEIPRGAYVPVFLPRAVASPVPVAEPGPRPSAEPPPMLGSAPAILETTGSTAAAPRARSWPGALPVALSLLLLALCGCAVLGWQLYRTRAQIEPWKTEPVRAALWSQFFDSGEELDIVTADTSFALAEDILGRPIGLDDYLDYRYRSFVDAPGVSPEKRAIVQIILDRNNGSIGDFQAAEQFLNLAAHSRAVKLAGARSYTPESIRSNNVILIGARESNPWVEMYRSRLNFFLEYDPATQRSYIVNRQPLPGEQATYEPSQRRTEAYSVVAFLPNLTTGKLVLIVSGSDSQATRAAGEFVTSSEGLAQVRQRMPTGAFPFFEVVLGSSRMAGTTLDTRVVAMRLHPR